MSAAPTMNDCLQPSTCIDSTHPEVLRLVRSLVEPGQSLQDSALVLYYWVRDKIRYNPYALGLSQDYFLASATLANGEGWCVPKAILLAALCRATGIPARVGFADVRNHLSTERLRAAMGTDIFYFHGYTSLYLNDKWVKATPAFNIELCEKFGLLPLEFDGVHDSLYHAFDAGGSRHMEYLNDRGEYLDLPFEELDAVFRQHYPQMYAQYDDDTSAPLGHASWEDDVAKEVS